MIPFLITLLILAILSYVNIVISSGKYAPGNKEEYCVANTPVLPGSPLEGKTIIFLGSSVTAGSAAGGESFVDYLAKRNSITAVKEAVSGTTLIDKDVYGKKSYITRLKTIDPSIAADALICQLSTNDATMKKPLGTVSDRFDMADFDTLTVAGAIEYVIAYAKKTWNCPVIFYTGTRYNNKHYAAMVDLLFKIQKKWDIGIMDLWNSPEMNSVCKEDYKLYMFNGIHPTKAGYRDWWTPAFEEYLTDYLQ